MNPTRTPRDSDSTRALPRWRRSLAGAALLAIVGFAVIAFWPRTAVAGMSWAQGHSVHSVTAAVPAGVIDPDDAQVTDFGDAPETSLGAAASRPTTDDAVERDADTLPGERDAIAPEETMDDADAAIGGCVEAYGDSGQCLTSIPPSLAEHAAAMTDAGLDPSTMPHEWTCGELLLYFPDGILVRQDGVDPQNLDGDGNGTACSPGD